MRMDDSGSQGRGRQWIPREVFFTLFFTLFFSLPFLYLCRIPRKSSHAAQTSAPQGMSLLGGHCAATEQVLGLGPGKTASL